MTTVFAILLIVINLGKGLIVLVTNMRPKRLLSKTSDTTKTDGYIHTGCRHHEPDYCRNRIGCKCYDRWKRQNR